VNAPLYNIRILRLAAEVANHPRLSTPMASVEKRSPVCGSRVAVDLDLDADGRIATIGLYVSACALGQASASLMAAHAVGRSTAEIAETRDVLAEWLGGEGTAPAWPGLDLFDAARPYAARHASIRLAFEAAADAAIKAGAAA